MFLLSHYKVLLSLLAYLITSDFFCDNRTSIFINGFNIRNSYNKLTSSSAIADYPTFNIMSNTKVEWPKVLTMKDFNLLHIEDFYPALGRTLLDVVEAWNPDVQEPPSVFLEELQHLNFSDPVEREIAERLRDLEVPFKIYGFNGLDDVIRKWTDDYLIKNIDRDNVERSKTNHFMYWADKGSRNPEGYIGPTDRVDMSFSSWLANAKRADAERYPNDKEHLYFHLSTRSRREKLFINKDLAFLSTEQPNFWISRPSDNKGIQCRLGMRGIIAESHFDHGRNTICMIKGNKRYILNPPESCKHLGVISDRNHPSYRHSVFDWSDVEQAKSHGFNKVKAIDTIVREGEVLYIPSYWLHYVISLQYSIQCNSRSGAPESEKGQSHANECVDRLNFKRNSKKKKKDKHI